MVIVTKADALLFEKTCCAASANSSAELPNTETLRGWRQTHHVDPPEDCNGAACSSAWSTGHSSAGLQ